MTKQKSFDANGPIWFDGTNINEALFCDDFLSTRKIIFANGAFLRLMAELQMIYPCVAKSLRN